MVPGSRRPRVLFVGSSDLDLPLPPPLAKKWDAVARELDVRVIGREHAIRAADPRFRPEAIITKSPYEAFALLPVWRLARPRPKLLVDLHGDWRTAPRLYGSRLRRLAARLTDRAALLALRRADGTRAISAYTASLAGNATGRRPIGVFPAYFDLESFTSEPPRPLPERPAVAWIGVLQRYKDPRVMADAWRRVAGRSTGSRLIVVGRGPLKPIVDELAREFPSRVSAIPELSPPEVAKLLDQSTLLAMSSASEGLGRVIMEAFSRGRPVVGTAVGGIPDLVTHGRNGLLVPARDPEALADALVRVLEDRELAERLARGAREDAEQLRWTPERYAEVLRRFVDSALTV